MAKQPTLLYFTTYKRKGDIIMFEKSCELIYDMIAKRIITRRDYLKLKNKDLCPYADASLISAITHNRRHEKKNKYLIPDGTRNSYQSGNDTPFIKIISSALKYESPIELIVGDDAELEEYAGYLFLQMILDSLEDKKLSASIEALLDDYIPYAKKHFYLEAESTDGIMSEAIIKKYYTDIEEYPLEREKAIARLFSIHKDEFISQLKVFFEPQPDTIKLDKRLSAFMSTVIIPIMNNNRDNYVSVSAKKMLNEIQQLWKNALEQELVVDTVYRCSGHYEEDDRISRLSIIEAIIDADITYIDSLANIQLKSEGAPDTTLFMNRWEPYMCLEALL